MRRVGMSQGEIQAALLQANADRCRPPLDPREVYRIAESIGRYEPDQISVALVENHWEQMIAGAKPPEFQFTAITSRELATNTYDLEYLVDGVLVRGQPTVIAGPKKTLKTNISIDLAQETGCTPILCHHLKKSVNEPYEPAELENIAWAGFQEFVRRWILLNRRVRYDPDHGGHHELWMSVGGSAGHSGLWGLNIDEGQDHGGRRWEVEVISASEAFAQRVDVAHEQSEERKQRQQQSRDEKHREALLKALRLYPEGETPRVIRETAALSGAVGGNCRHLGDHACRSNSGRSTGSSPTTRTRGSMTTPWTRSRGRSGSSGSGSRSWWTRTAWSSSATRG
jgi:hypothetical protein